MSERWIGTPVFVAIIGVPLAFVFLGAISYGVARQFGGFFPGLGYWLCLIGVALLGGVIAISFERKWSVPARGAAAIAYVITMGAALFLLQGVVSCLNGDCF